MKRHLSKQEVMFKLKTEATAFMATGKAVKLISVIVLHEQFGFREEELKLFLDSFEDVLEHYNKSDDYHELLEEWDEWVEQETGERILWKTK